MHAHTDVTRCLLTPIADISLKAVVSKKRGPSPCCSVSKNCAPWWSKADPFGKTKRLRGFESTLSVSALWFPRVAGDLPCPPICSPNSRPFTRRAKLPQDWRKGLGRAIVIGSNLSPTARGVPILLFCYSLTERHT